MDTAIRTREVLTKTDLVVGTVIAGAMATAFTLLSSGTSLIVTFVPGVVLAWLTYVWLFVKESPLPRADAFLPQFFALLAVQFLHFAEEYTTGFRSAFPSLYGGAPYSAELFVTFNMVAYFVASIACILVFTQRIRFLLVPVLFFVIYGAIGNAISHSWWSVYLHSYFPGLITAQIYWLAGPFVLSTLLSGRRAAGTVTVLFGCVLMSLLTLFASRGG